MTKSIQFVENFLDDNGISYLSHLHPAVFTCEEAEIHCDKVPGIAGKNLFLRGKKSKKFYLVVLPAEKRANIKQIAEIVGDKHLSFGSATDLEAKLGLLPGSVSPFGLLNDKECEVGVYVDREIYNSEVVNFHPNDNRASLEIRKEMFHKYLNIIPHEVKIIDLA